MAFFNKFDKPVFLKEESYVTENSKFKFKDMLPIENRDYAELIYD